MKKAKLLIDYNFLTNCPYCGHMIDLASGDYDTDGAYSKPIFTNQWNELRGTVTNCGNCGEDFEINEVER